MVPPCRDEIADCSEKAYVQRASCSMHHATRFAQHTCNVPPCNRLGPRYNVRRAMFGTQPTTSCMQRTSCNLKARHIILYVAPRLQHLACCVRHDVRNSACVACCTPRVADRGPYAYRYLSLPLSYTLALLTFSQRPADFAAYAEQASRVESSARRARAHVCCGAGAHERARPRVYARYSRCVRLVRVRACDDPAGQIPGCSGVGIWGSPCDLMRAT